MILNDAEKTEISTDIKSIVITIYKKNKKYFQDNIMINYDVGSESFEYTEVSDLLSDARKITKIMKGVRK